MAHVDELTFLAGATLLVAGTALCLPTARWRASLTLQIAGLVLAGFTGTAAMFSGADTGSGFHDGYAPALGLDRLSGFFLAMVAVVAVPALMHAREGLRAAPAARLLTVLTGCFCVALCGLLAARDVTTFLVFWELMTLLPAAAILVTNSNGDARRDVFIYLAVTHLGGVGVWVALLTLAHYGALSGVPLHSQGLRALIAALAIVGFGTKAGLVPLHFWLPRAHPLAPPHVSALMSGVMVKLALYGLIRVLFQWDTPVPVWASLLLLGLGAGSALIGITLAAFQRELKRLLAFCTVENVGIVALGLSASLLLAATGHPAWASVAFAAAMLQSLVHALAKSTLFLAAGSLGSRVGKLELDRLGGLLTRMPWSAAATIVAMLSLAGLPPLGGFASEWLTLQALIHLALGNAAHDRGIAAAATLVAVVLVTAAAMALLTFTVAAGLTLLGSPRTPAAAEAAETEPLRWLALLAPALLCLVLGVIPGLLLPVLERLRPGSTTAPSHAGASIAIAGTGSLPTLGVLLSLAVVVALLWLARGADHRQRPTPRAAPAPIWISGQHPTPALAWNAGGFTETLRLMSHGVVPRLLGLRLLEPASAGALRLAAYARRLQSGSLTSYIGYLLALLVLTLGLFRLGLLG